MENKVTVIAKEGQAKVLVGNDIIQLLDLSNSTFKTDNIAAFFDFCDGCLSDSPNLLALFYNLSSVVLTHKYSNRNTVETAICRIVQSEQLSRLENVLNKDASLGDFEEFLTQYRDALAPSGKQLLSYLKDFKMSKITNVERFRDSQGNFSYKVSRNRQTSTDNNVEIPEHLSFTVPLMDQVDSLATFNLDLFFTWKETDDGLALAFRLRSFVFQSEKKRQFKEVIESYLKKLSFPKYWGEIEVTKLDNSWSYRENRVTG